MSGGFEWPDLERRGFGAVGDMCDVSTGLKGWRMFTIHGFRHGCDVARKREMDGEW